MLASMTGLAWKRLGVVIAAAHGATAIAAGAFAAHGASPSAGELLRTGAAWQSVAALAALYCSWRGAGLAGVLFLFGGAAFAGALYALAFGAPPVFGAVAPVGGGSLILAWAALAWREITAPAGD